MMNFNPDIHHRKSIRLKGYDYSQDGAYFVTICAQNRECLFGEIKDGKMILNDAGTFVKECWNETPKRYPIVILDEFVVMPNHFHGIIFIIDERVDRAGTRPAPTNINGNVGAPLVGAQNVVRSQNYPTIGNIIGEFKSITTHEYINGVKNKNWQPFEKRLWQRNYYEHIIRTDKSLNEIREYIIDNPANWEKDELYNLL